MKTADKFTDQMRAWVGRNEADGSHRAIIDIYNGHKPLARGYKVKYTDAWCAATVSAAAISCGYTDIIPIECSCQRMIQLAQGMGIWVENDTYVPTPGDIILYDWQDSGKGNNTGWADHIGVVENCDGQTITVIEGNLKDAVGRRNIAVNGKYIRGFITPRFEKEPVKEPEKSLKSIDEIAREVINGKWGNGAERKRRLEAEGYSYTEVQAKVNELFRKPSTTPAKPKKTLNEVAREVINGKYGNGAERKRRIPAETDYTYAEVQAEVNRILK